MPRVPGPAPPDLQCLQSLFLLTRPRSGPWFGGPVPTGCSEPEVPSPLVHPADASPPTVPDDPAAG